MVACLGAKQTRSGPWTHAIKWLLGVWRELPGVDGGFGVLSQETQLGQVARAASRREEWHAAGSAYVHTQRLQHSFATEVQGIGWRDSLRIHSSWPCTLNILVQPLQVGYRVRFLWLDEVEGIQVVAFTDSSVQHCMETWFHMFRMQFDGLVMDAFVAVPVFDSYLQDFHAFHEFCMRHHTVLTYELVSERFAGRVWDLAP